MILRLMILAFALMITMLGLWISTATGGWLFHHVAPLVQSRWFRPACMMVTMACSAFTTVYVIVASQKRRKAQTDEQMTPLPPASQRLL
jgi:hypothetical protein